MNPSTHWTLHETKPGHRGTLGELHALKQPGRAFGDFLNWFIEKHRKVKQFECFREIRENQAVELLDVEQQFVVDADFIIILSRGISTATEGI